MKYTIEIECDNAAFQDELLPQEVARILRSLAEKCIRLHVSLPEVPIYDLYGNRVGQAKVTGE